jgi:MtfA peptidase
MLEPVVAHILKLLYEACVRIYFSTFVKPKISILLQQHSTYYCLLGSDQAAFRRKVWDFTRFTKFVGRGEVKVDFKLKVIIASHAIQLSFRLSDECYDHYEKILVYKEYYLSRITRQYHKAEVNPAMRIIVFSIRAIHESLEHSADGLNVLLHEFAHALWLEHLLKGHEYQVFREHTFNRVRKMMSSYMQDEAFRESSFFRRYAFTNEAEFFAVAVENFFERAKDFRKELPQLYDALAKLFRQDTSELQPLTDR